MATYFNNLSIAKKLYGFAGCDPTQPGYMDELRHGIEDLGLVVVKMGPMYAGFDPRDGRCTPVYDYCQERGLPVLFHSGTTFIRAARASPSESGSIPTIAPISRCCAVRMTLIIRSVPMLPDPMIATFVLPISCSSVLLLLGEVHGD